MTMNYPIRYMARVVIEFETPFIVGAGDPDFFSDAVFVADANGLPALPGSSIAGVLRHEFAKDYPNAASCFFGYHKKGESKGSRLTISWGCIHDGKNTPVEGIVRAVRMNDSVLRTAFYSTARDHVCITHKGTAKVGGKFDERVVSAGHRFTFEMMLEGNENDSKDWDSLTDLLASNTLRLGGKTRRGYGAFKVISLKKRAFDLQKPQDFKDFQEHPVELSKSVMMEEIMREKGRDSSDTTITATAELRPTGFWMIGGGASDEADITPVFESRIHWTDGHGKPGEEEVLIPGASVKGVLSHRVAHYHNALENVFLEDIQAEEIEKYVGSNNTAVRELFGYCKNDDEKETGQRGRVFIDDVFIGKPQQKILNHVSLDRFTGGARTMTGALFSEYPFYKGDGFTFKLTVSDPKSVSAQARKALELALKDLTEERLPLGLGAGRGNGFFKAANPIEWSDNGKWIGGGQ